jgi:hypothetical protein
LPPLTAIAAAAALALPASAFADAPDRDVNNEAEIKHSIELEARYAVHACKAQLELEYYQKGADVHVDSVLSNAACAASSGSYVIEVRYRGADDVVVSRRFDETWERSDAAPVRASKVYPVGDNVDVVRVRPRKLRCTCSDVGDEALQ